MMMAREQVARLAEAKIGTWGSVGPASRGSRCWIRPALMNRSWISWASASVWLLLGIDLKRN